MQSLLAQNSSTYSKRTDQHVFNWPQYFDDSTVAKYTDWVCGLGSNLYGWQNNFSCHHVKELELSEKLLAKLPFCDQVKFLKTGSAACEAAIRIARAHTGRKKVLGQGYHGCANVFIAAESPGLGCVDEGYQKFGFLPMLYQGINSETAAVIIEPVQLDYTEQRKKEVSDVYKRCREMGAMLIFDEVITGFRVPNFFVANDWGIYPDIICGGKGLGNGYPLAFVAGKEEWMEKDYFISNTHNGELSGIRAALHTLDQIAAHEINTAWNIGRYLMRNINHIIEKHSFGLIGYPTRGEWQGDQLEHAKYCELMADMGHLVGKAWFFNLEITVQQIENFIQCTQEAINSMEKGYQLRGYVPQPIFRRN